MRKQYNIAIVGIIGAILAVPGMMSNDAFALEDDEMLQKMVTLEQKLQELAQTNGSFEDISMGSIGFEIKQIKKVLLEINEKNNENNDNVNEKYNSVSENFNQLITKYEKDVKSYQKENGLTSQERKITNSIFKEKISFEKIESEQDKEKETQKLIKKTIKETKAKKEFQKIINKIGMKLADESNGGKIENEHYQLALNEIVKSEKWDLAIPAIDRTITQVSADKEIVENLIEVKQNIKTVLEIKEKQEQVELSALKNENNQQENKLLKFNVDEEANTGSDIAEKLTDDKIVNKIKEIQKTKLNEIENKLQVIKPILTAEISKSIEKASKTIEEKKQQVEEKREEQREEKRQEDKKKPIVEEKDEKKEVLTKKEQKKKEQQEKKEQKKKE
uniref:hypothetical protein n=1 Tax=Nitrosopumilus sp. TaxID=2024843 RepID=UPI00262A7835